MIKFRTVIFEDNGDHRKLLEEVVRTAIVEAGIGGADVPIVQVRNQWKEEAEQLAREEDWAGKQVWLIDLKSDSAAGHYQSEYQEWWEDFKREKFLVPPSTSPIDLGELYKRDKVVAQRTTEEGWHKWAGILVALHALRNGIPFMMTTEGPMSSSPIYQLLAKRADRKVLEKDFVIIPPATTSDDLGAQEDVEEHRQKMRDAKAKYLRFIRANILVDLHIGPLHAEVWRRIRGADAPEGDGLLARFDEWYSRLDPIVREEIEAKGKGYNKSLRDFLEVDFHPHHTEGGDHAEGTGETAIEGWYRHPDFWAHLLFPRDIASLLRDELGFDLSEDYGGKIEAAAHFRRPPLRALLQDDTVAKDMTACLGAWEKFLERNEHGNGRHELVIENHIDGNFDYLWLNLPALLGPLTEAFIWENPPLSAPSRSPRFRFVVVQQAVSTGEGEVYGLLVRCYLDEGGRPYNENFPGKPKKKSKNEADLVVPEDAVDVSVSDEGGEKKEADSKVIQAVNAAFDHGAWWVFYSGLSDDESNARKWHLLIPKESDGWKLHIKEQEAAPEDPTLGIFIPVGTTKSIFKNGALRYCVRSPRNDLRKNPPCGVDEEAQKAILECMRHKPEEGAIVTL